MQAASRADDIMIRDNFLAEVRQNSMASRCPSQGPRLLVLHDTDSASLLCFDDMRSP